MKTFIFILILIIGFFYYLFTNDPKPLNKTTDTLTNLEDLEQHNDHNNIEENKEEVKKLKEYTTLAAEVPTAIPEDQTFETIKNILKESYGRENAPKITLNTRITSYLYTSDSREKFKQSISSSFNLSYDEVDKKFKDNKLVWDWVNQLKD